MKPEVYCELESGLDMDIRTFYYDSYFNRMVDEDGYIVPNIYLYVSPLMYNMFRREKETMVFQTGIRTAVELIWPEESDDLDYDIDEELPLK